MVRIGEGTYSLLRKRAEEEGKTLQAVLDEAIREYDRLRFFEQADTAYQALRAHPTAWEAEREERESWDSTLMDDLDEDEVWPMDANAASPHQGARKNA